MRINFPIVTLPHITFSKPQNSSSALKPLPFDTFERISFTKSSPVTPIQHGGCATSNFEIKNIPNLHCPVCGLLMLTDEQVEEFVQDVQHKRGYDLIKALEKYEDESVFTGVKSNPPKSIYRPLKQEIVDIIKDLAAQHESASLSELVQMEARNRIDSLIASQMAVMRELEQYVKSSNATRNEKEYIYNILSSFKREILGEGDNKFARKRF
ncbi:hypothetical protein IJ531_00005, partial [bacterium]|nr:hypothetical protein [bacterium]